VMRKMKAIIRFTKTHVLVLCELGHLIEASPLGKDFAGSNFEAEVTFHCENDRFERLAKNCKGYGH